MSESSVVFLKPRCFSSYVSFTVSEFVFVQLKNDVLLSTG